MGDPDPGDDPGPLLAAAFSNDPWCECLPAVLAGTVVGFVLFCRRFKAHTGLRSLWVADLAVVRSRRGQGAGQALLRAVQGRAMKLGATGINLEVWKQNRAALSFYGQAGATVLDGLHVLHLTMAGKTES